MDARKKLLRISFVLLAGLALVIFLGNSESESPATSSNNETEEVLPTDNINQPIELNTLKNFTPSEFKDAYDNLSLPNITPIVVAPEITGNLAADARIRSLAEARGYALRQVASGLLNSLDGKPVQEMLITDWLNLQQMAREEGISIEFRSGYRSIEDQRKLFTDRLGASGGIAADIAAGSQDDIIEVVLRQTAPPGYSRHHSGYTIDLENPGYSVFLGSPAHAWVSANNFEKAKLHGFIPSYPDGLENQGPNPEPWEFVWVSKNNTFE